MDGHKNKIMVKEIFSLHEDAAEKQWKRRKRIMIRNTIIIIIPSIVYAVGLVA